MGLYNRPCIVSSMKGGDLHVSLEDSPAECCLIESASAIDFLRAAGLLWGFEDLAAGAEIVGYQSAWDVAQQYACAVVGRSDADTGETLKLRDPFGGNK